MKAPSSALFELIKTMNREEKKYFSRFIFLEKRDAKNTLLYNMFSVMNGMSVYNEEEIKKKLNNKLKGASFKTYKSVLKEKIFQSLSAQGTCVSERTSYRRKIEQAEILAAKGLGKYSVEVLSNVKNTLIPEFHITGLLAQTDVRITELWMMMNTSRNNTDDIPSLSTTILNSTCELHNTLLAYTYSKKLASFANCSLLMQTKSEQEQFDEINDKFITETGPFKENEPFFITEGRSAKALIETDFSKAYEYANLVWHRYSILHHHTLIKENDYVFYGRLLHSVITTLIYADRKEMLPSLVSYSFLSYENTPGSYETEYYYPIFIYGMLINYYWKKDEEGMKKQLDSVTGLSVWNQSKPDILIYRTLATWSAIVYHSQGNYEKALTWCRKVTATDPNDLVQVHYFEFCKLFQFIIEYDLESSSGKKISKSFICSVESVCEQIRKKSEKDRSYTATFLLFFKRISECSKEQKRLEILQKLKIDVLELKQSSTSKYFNALFDFDSWIDKTENGINAEAA